MSAVGDPASFWAQTLTPGDCVSLAAKYRALAALEAEAPGPARDRAIRQAARRWPGSLRESQLAGPAVCARRLRALRAGLCEPTRSRAAWCAHDPGVPLWAALHPLLGDLVEWRQRAGGGDLAALRAFVEGPERPERAARWASLAGLSAAGPRVRVRLAYRLLAHDAGLSQLQLSYALFARRGPWERRGGDLPGPERAGLPIEIAEFFDVP